MPAERAALHRRVAGELEDAAERAYHCDRAGHARGGAGGVAAAGAEASAVFAYDAALLHYERALRLGARSPEVLAACRAGGTLHRRAGASGRAVP